jgi:REP element-mobilizing transposase RayT
LSPQQIKCVAEGFAQASEKYDCAIVACAIMRDHVHLVPLRHELGAEKLVEYFKSAASRVLRERGLHPFQHLEKPDGRLPKVWQDGSWPVFLDSEDAIFGCIRYVEKNPEKEGLPRQNWSFVVPYANQRIT